MQATSVNPSWFPFLALTTPPPPTSPSPRRRWEGGERRVEDRTAEYRNGGFGRRWACADGRIIAALTRKTNRARTTSSPRAAAREQRARGYIQSPCREAALSLTLGFPSPRVYSLTGVRPIVRTKRRHRDGDSVAGSRYLVHTFRHA